MTKRGDQGCAAGLKEEQAKVRGGSQVGRFAPVIAQAKLEEGAVQWVCGDQELQAAFLLYCVSFALFNNW